MALNKFMHPRNRYKKNKPDYKALAVKYPEFRRHVTIDLTGKVYVDYKDPQALRALSCTLLKHDFDLEVHIPLNRLVPTVPLRLNYIHWLEDIIGSRASVKGIDIGTGSSCIYPLLGCKMNSWQFLATEVDEENFKFAVKNVELNKFSDSINVCQVSENALILEVICDTEETYDFTMCNPPFYSDHLEAQAVTTSRSIDRPEPSSTNTGSERECIARGGEVAFVTRMIKESLQLKGRVRVFTSMVGKKGSIAVLKGELRKHKVPKFAVTEFCQGKTMRWGLAWTFDESVEFQKSQFQVKEKKKPPLSYTIPRNIPGLAYDLPSVQKFIEEILHILQIKFKVINSSERVTALAIKAGENTWSHQRRKRRQKLFHEESPEPETKKTVGTEFGKIEKCERSDVVGKKNVENIKFHNTDDCVSSISQTGTKEQSLDSASVENNKKRLLDTDDNNPECKRQKISQSILEDEKCEPGESDQIVGNRNNNSHLSSNAITFEKASLQDLNMPSGNNETVPNKVKSEIGPQDTLKNVPNDTEDMDLVPVEIEGEVHTKSKICVEPIGTEKNADDEKMDTHVEITPSKCKEEFLLKCKLIIKQKTQEEIGIEMIFVAGENREHMHQVMQYLKNRLVPC